MLFNSLDFLIFMAVVFPLYWGWFHRTRERRNLFLVAVSYFFYGWWDVRFLALIMVSSAVDYLVGRALEVETHTSRRKGLLALSIATNLGILGFFKYFNFFVDSLRTLGMPLQPGTLNIILPVGISFYTFQTLSYTVDIYRKKVEATRDAPAFFAFVSFFPQLVAGPIERAGRLLPQFVGPSRPFSFAAARAGLELILWGFFKKVVVADRLAPFVETVYASPRSFEGIPLVLATVFFALQIYCDFSGYSDIAIGVARLFGFDLCTNFRTPYLACSLREFWSRWHISLSTWFRDYVYIPLGGNRNAWSRNFIVTFLLSGLWHGANWTFVAWGAIHGVLGAAEAVLRKRGLSLPGGRVPSWLLTMVVVCAAWVFFRAQNVSEALYILTHGVSGWSAQLASTTDLVVMCKSMGLTSEALKLLAPSLLLFLIVEVWMGTRPIDRALAGVKRPPRWAFYYLLATWTALFGAFNEAKRFIYFQF